jgi:hypothetical protein
MDFLEFMNKCSREQFVTMLVSLLLSCSTFAVAASLWSSKPASWDTTNEAFLIGNGKLGGKLTDVLAGMGYGEMLIVHLL